MAKRTTCLFDGCDDPITQLKGPGRPRTFCDEHRQEKYRGDRTRQHHQRSVIGRGSGPNYNMALRVSDMRLAAEQAKSMIRMALLDPAKCNDFLHTALAHLEEVTNGRRRRVASDRRIPTLPS